jgi:RNA polymerase sigma-70 factor (ECF subfamily)
VGQNSGRRWGAARPATTHADGPARVSTDGDLLRGTGRDPELFGTFFDRHYDDVLRFFWLRTADAEVAADLAAETFAAALEGLTRFDESKGPAVAWLFGIADKQLRQWLRRGRVARRARNRLGLDPIRFDETGYERVEVLRDMRAIVEPLSAALSSLPLNVRRAVELRVFDQLEYATVARELGCTEGAARVRVSRGLKQIFEAVVTDADR